MVDYDKLHITDIYNWTILPNQNGEGVFIIYCERTMIMGESVFPVFTFYKNQDRISLNGTMIYCDSFDKANKLVLDVLKVNGWKPHERYLGRYFKLKKIINI